MNTEPQTDAHMEVDNPTPLSANEERLQKSRIAISNFMDKQAEALDSVLALNARLDQPDLSEIARTTLLEQQKAAEAKLASIEAKIANLQNFRNNLETEMARAEKG